MSTYSSYVNMCVFPMLGCTGEDYKSSSYLSSELFYTGARAEPLRSPIKAEGRASSRQRLDVWKASGLSYDYWYSWLLSQEESS
jgi:hypothetical protein